METSCALHKLAIFRLSYRTLVPHLQTSWYFNLAAMDDRSGPGYIGGRVNTLVPGHRAIYKEAGITKKQTKAGRTRYNQQTPAQEHQARADGKIIESRKAPEEINLDE